MASNMLNRIQLFNGENYASWKPQMEAVLHKARLSGYVNGTNQRPEAAADQPGWEEKDLDARAELLLAIEPSIVSLVKDKKLSKDVWKFLSETYDRKGPRQKAEEFRRLINMKMEVHQSMDEFIREFKTTVNKLQEMDAKFDKDLLVVVLLDRLSEDYKDVQAAFDAQSKYPDVDVVCSRLLEEETNGQITSHKLHNFPMERQFFQAVASHLEEF